MGKPVAPASTPVGRNPERELSAKAGGHSSRRVKLHTQAGL